jgi:hypothetical protein
LEGGVDREKPPTKQARLIGGGGYPEDSHQMTICKSLRTGQAFERHVLTTGECFVDFRRLSDFYSLEAHSVTSNTHQVEQCFVPELVGEHYRVP